MKLEDIAAFTEDGCLLSPRERETDVRSSLTKRIDLLDRHIDNLDEQIKRLENVKAHALEKREIYFELLNAQPPR